MAICFPFGDQDTKKGTFNKRLDDTEFENILVVGVVSGNPPDENPPTSCIFDRSRNWIAGEPAAPLNSHNTATSSGIPSGFGRICRGALQLEKAVTSVVGAKYKQLILYCSYK